MPRSGRGRPWEGTVPPGGTAGAYGDHPVSPKHGGKVFTEQPWPCGASRVDQAGLAGPGTTPRRVAVGPRGSLPELSTFPPPPAPLERGDLHGQGAP
ncbi:hypothetical protein GCM10027162_24230 [Streptomyces incanus]